VLIFLILILILILIAIAIAIAIVLSHILYLLGASVSFRIINPDTGKVETETTAANSLMTGERIHHISGWFRTSSASVQSAFWSSP
jgi:preprotein translocase subunit YajC